MHGITDHLAVHNMRKYKYDLWQLQNIINYNNNHNSALQYNILLHCSKLILDNK